MHNLALALQKNGHQVSGSDDEIYNPARDRLAAQQLLPDAMGWFPNRITTDLDAVILGMHARTDNPELQKAQSLQIPIYSFPEFVYQQAQRKKRIVIAGSHGKTTTTAMIMHLLQGAKRPFDYLVGAQLTGFDTMVQFSDAPLMVIEGDEYLSSPLDRRPKFVHYQPDLLVITGIEHDHINVFPTFSEYKAQFANLLSSLPPTTTAFLYQHDPHLQAIVATTHINAQIHWYEAFPYDIAIGKTYALGADDVWHELNIFGKHNLENLRAAFLVAQALGITEQSCWTYIESFSGAAKRLQTLSTKPTSITFQDFAHAPSKVRATTKAVSEQYPHRQLLAVLELHTFSSLNQNFLPQYAHTLDAASEAFVYFSEHTLEMKKLPPLNKATIQAAFQHPNLRVFTDAKALQAAIAQTSFNEKNLLLMSSGKFGGIDITAF